MRSQPAMCQRCLGRRAPPRTAGLYFHTRCVVLPCPPEQHQGQLVFRVQLVHNARQHLLPSGRVHGRWETVVDRNPTPSRRCPVTPGPCSGVLQAYAAPGTPAGCSANSAEAQRGC